MYKTVAVKETLHVEEKHRDAESTMKRKTMQKKYMKEATVIADTNGTEDVKIMDIITAVTTKFGEGKILAIRPRHNKEFELKLETEEVCEALTEGLMLKNKLCEVRKLCNWDYMVSFLHQIVYTDDIEIIHKLHNWGVTPMTKINRRFHPGTKIEDGTRFVRV